MFAAARTFIRIKKFRCILADDCFVFLAVLCLIAGTGILYINVPYIYLQLNVEAGVQAPPADFLQQLLYDERLQNAVTVLILTALFSVKWAFLFFFRCLIGRTDWLRAWWWTVLAILIPGTVFGTFTNIIACPYSGPSILGMYNAALDLISLVTFWTEKCTTPGALLREQVILYASVGVDVGTDALSKSLVLHYRTTNMLRLISYSHLYPGSTILADSNDNTPEAFFSRSAVPELSYDNHQHRNSRQVKGFERTTRFHLVKLLDLSRSRYCSYDNISRRVPLSFCYHQIKSAGDAKVKAWAE